jgi:hypothetical protein
MITLLLILHSLVGVALLGAVTHQCVSLLRNRSAPGASFIQRYAAVDHRVFAVAVVLLYVIQLTLGAIIYPAYRLNVRIPFEEMRLNWAIGVFELKEHFAGIGLGLLPFYAYAWRPSVDGHRRPERTSITMVLTFIIWWDFLVGHILNNIRGLG